MKSSNRVMKKVSDKFHRFLVIFAGVALKLEKVGSTFSSVSP